MCNTLFFQKVLSVVPLTKLNPSEEVIKEATSTKVFHKSKVTSFFAFGTLHFVIHVYLYEKLPLNSL